MYTDLADSTGMFAKSVFALGSAEEHTSLSRALSQLAEVEEKVDLIHIEQAENDFFIFGELIKDYIGMMQSIKVRRTILYCETTFFYRKQGRVSRLI